MQPYGSFLLDNKTKISSSMSQQSFNDVLKAWVSKLTVLKPGYHNKTWKAYVLNPSVCNKFLNVGLINLNQTTFLGTGINHHPF